MKTKTLKEILTTPNSGLFTAFISPVWAEAFPDTAELDIYFFTRYGDRIANKLIAFYENDAGIVAGDNLTALAKMIYDINARKWEHLFGVYEAEYNPLYNTEYVETVKDRTEVEANIDTSGSDSTTLGSVVTNERQGFNSTNYLGDNKSTTSGGDSSTSSAETDSTSNTDYNSERRKAGNIGVTSTIQLISEEVDYWSKFRFIDHICRDICDIITLSIY